MKLLVSSAGVRMLVLSNLPTLSIWDFAVTFYQMPGVEADCLAAQDHYGLDVTALIFALYCTHKDVGFDAAQAVELARSLSEQVVEPLRKARIALKSVPSLVDLAAADALRQTVKSAELEAERLTLEALSRQPTSDFPFPYEAALSAIVNARQVPADNDLSALLKRLALCAQNV